MAKAKYIVTTRFVEANNAQRLFGENVGYDPKTKKPIDGFVIRVEDTLYPENLCSRLFTDETKSTLAGVAIKEFKKVS